MARERLLRLAGASAGLLAAVLLAGGPEADAGPAVALPVLALLLGAGLVAADRTVARPAEVGVRTALLVRRRVLDLVPRRRAAGVLVLAVALTGLLAVTGIASTPHTFSADTPALDDGRHLGCVPGSLPQTGAWPGWYYAIPVLATLAVAIAVAVVALRWLVVRPVAGPGPAGEAYRRRAASAIVDALGLLVAVPLAGAAYFAYAVLDQPFACEVPDPSAPWLRAWLVALMVVAATAAAYYAARLIFPTARPRLRPAGPAAPTDPTRSADPGRR